MWERGPRFAIQRGGKKSDGGQIKKIFNLRKCLFIKYLDIFSYKGKNFFSIYCFFRNNIYIFGVFFDILKNGKQPEKTPPLHRSKK